MAIQKLKAGALQMTIFISLVIALLLTAFIMFVHLHKRLNIQHDFIVEMVHDADRGIRYCLNVPMTFNGVISLDQDSVNYKSIDLHRDYWGLFEKAISTAKIKQGQFEKVALIGGAQPKEQRTALYLEDNNNPLVLVGNTKIKGLAYLPQKGVKIGSILGKSYYGTELIYGPKKTAAKLPRLESSIINNLKSMFEMDEIFDTDFMLDIKPGHSYMNSFLQPTQMVFSYRQIDLAQINLTGNIIIKSRTRISVDRTSNLIDVILIAPEIEIKSDVTGNFQAIASQLITVGENSVLAYPSALILVEDQSSVESNKSPNSPQIQIKYGSNVKGVVVFEGKKNENKSKINVELKKGATITGELYCNQNLDLSGQVFGSVFTHNFIAKQSDYIFQNHIYNGQINIDKLPTQYVGLPFNESKKGVLKWLY